MQEAPGGVCVEPGLPARLDADGVGFQFLVARKLRKPELAADQRDIGVRVFAEKIGRDLGRQNLVGFLLLALQAVIGRDVAHLMGDHGGEFG